MRTNRAFVAVPTVLLSVGLVAGCGGSSSKSASSATDSAKGAASSAQASAGSSNSGSSGDASTSCPTENTRKFAKTRFATDVGLAAGTFHRYIYKPYQDGAFKKGDVDKTAAVKAAIAAGADYKLLKNASENAKANPTLCKKVAQPLSEAMDKLKNVDKKQLLMGNVGGLVGAKSGISDVLKGSKESGQDVKQSDNLDEAKKAVGSN